LVATGIEAASMVPDLGAMGILAVSDLSLLESSVVLIGNCLVDPLPHRLLPIR
jgi:hypothetical protein